MTTPRRLLTLTGLASLSLLALTACRSGDGRGIGTSGNARAQMGEETGAVITLDGDFGDWPEGVVATADEHHLYVRFTIDEQPFTLQAANESTSILLDVDGEASTGERLAPSELSGLGIDVEVVFSPPRANGRLGRGVAMYAVANDGTRTPMSVYDWDFSCTPTAASVWYEARISRTPAGTLPVPALTSGAGLLGTGTVRGTVALTNEQGALLAWAPRFEASMPARCMTGPRLSNVTAPAKPTQGVRVVSYNVLKSAPASKPEVFARIFRSLDADVYLLQEWEAATADIERWFATHLSDRGNWRVRSIGPNMSAGGGVAIASRLPITGPLLDVPIQTEDGKPVRFVAATITTPMGELAAGSTHLKCCGTMGSKEDEQRIREARAINRAFDSALAGRMGGIRVIAGDMNLVGSFSPLETLVSGIDLDGSELAIAPARTLGDRTHVTWSEAGDDFGPGRLDYILVSDASATIRSSFVLDTSRLSDEALRSMGLNRGDTADASDHMPVVVDLLP